MNDDEMAEIESSISASLDKLRTRQPLLTAAGCTGPLNAIQTARASAYGTIIALEAMKSRK